MKIFDYYNDYENNNEYSNFLNSNTKTSLTINDFYNDCISNNLLSYKDVIAWHNMLMEYVDLPDAIYWIRYHESKGKGYDKITKRHNNRRACFTRFSDGFSYVFVSNFDAHEIYNMISKGVVPTAQEFLSLMKSFKFPLHYDPGAHCEESDIVSYPNIGYYAAGVLTNNRWYLAHINAVKSEYIMPDKTYRTLSTNEAERIFPRGTISDWKLNTNNKFIRQLDYSLTNEEKEIVKAHFLRFVDPLNYFLTPSTKNEIDNVTKTRTNIGEFPNLTLFMREKFKQIYGSQVVSDFTKKALIPDLTTSEDGSTVIDIKYGTQVESYGSKASTSKAKPATQTTKTKSTAQIQKNNSGIGQYAKGIFINLLINNKLTQSQISNLMDKAYCRKTFKIYLPIIVLNTSSFDKGRYYKDLVCGKYYICSQWYIESKPLIDDWIKNNNL